MPTSTPEFKITIEKDGEVQSVCLTTFLEIRTGAFGTLIATGEIDKMFPTPLSKPPPGRGEWVHGPICNGQGHAYCDGHYE